MCLSVNKNNKIYDQKHLVSVSTDTVSDFKFCFVYLLRPVVILKILDVAPRKAVFQLDFCIVMKLILIVAHIISTICVTTFVFTITPFKW